jgi:hypothetical protein
LDIWEENKYSENDLQNQSIKCLSSAAKQEDS